MLKILSPTDDISFYLPDLAVLNLVEQVKQQLDRSQFTVSANTPLTEIQSGVLQDSFIIDQEILSISIAR